MKKKILQLLLIGAMTVILLAGCGNSEKESNQVSEGNTSESTIDQGDANESNVDESSRDEDMVEEVLVTDIDLDEARLWIYDSDSCYEADGSVIVHAELSRFLEEEIPYDKLRGVLADTIELYKAHGYSYVGDETDITSVNTDSFKKNSEIYFKLELTDPVLLAELENAILKAYVEEGNTLPEGEEYDALVKRVKNTVKEFSTLGIQVTYVSFKDVYSVWVYGEFRFNGAEFVRFTENFEWIARWLIYNEEDKIWQLEDF